MQVGETNGATFTSSASRAPAWLIRGPRVRSIDQSTPLAGFTMEDGNNRLHTTEQTIKSETVENEKKKPITLQFSLVNSPLCLHQTLPTESQQTKVIDSNNIEPWDEQVLSANQLITKPSQPPLCQKTATASFLKNNAGTTPRSPQRRKSNQIRESREQRRKLEKHRRRNSDRINRKTPEWR